MERSRNVWKCPLFGDACDIRDNRLPTYEEVMKFYEWTRHKIKYDMETKKEPTYKELKAIVVARIENIWTKSSIPFVKHKRVKAMLQAYHLKCKHLLKSNPKIPPRKLE